MVNCGYRYTDRISARFEGWTVLEYYVQRYGHSTPEEWLRRLRLGRILLNEKIVGHDHTICVGDVLHYDREPWEEPEAQQDFDVLSDTERWMVFDKPSGLPVLPGGGYLEHTMLHLARKRFGDAVAPVHRLGRGTTGAILFSRDPMSAAFLAAAMRERRIAKTYLTIVSGLPEEDYFQVDVPIGPVPHAYLGTVHAASASGKASVSHCRVLARNNETLCALVEVRIPTGRPHQIRIHCAAAGYPLQGDPLYILGGHPRSPGSDGAQAVPGDCGYILHSWKLEFPDPDDGSVRLIVAPPPDALELPGSDPAASVET